MAEQEKTAEMTPEEIAAYDDETRRQVVAAALEVDQSEEAYETKKLAASEAKKQLEADERRLRHLIRSRAEQRGKRPQTTLLDHAGEWRKKPVEALESTLGKEHPECFDKCLANCDDLGDLHEQCSAPRDDGQIPFGLTAEERDWVLAAIAPIIDAETAAAENPPTSATVPDDLFKQFPIERWKEFGITTGDVEKLHSGDIKGGGTCPIVTVGDLQNFITPNPATPGYARSLADIKGIGEAAVTRISDAEMKFWEHWRNGGDLEFAREKGYVAAVEPSEGEATGNPADAEKEAAAVA